MHLNYKADITSATIRLPGSKSISNRCIVLKEVLGLDVPLQNLSSAQDTSDLLKAMQQLREKKDNVIDIGHAGTDMRFLTSLLSVKKGEWILTGSDRMKQRPIGELVTALKSLGAEITYLEKEGFPPLKIIGKELEGGKVSVKADISSQFVSALLLIGPALKNGIEITLSGQIVSWPYILMTMDLLSEFGVKVSSVNQTLIVRPGTLPESLHLTDYFIESDWSAASYWYSLVAMGSFSEIRLIGLSQKSSQGDSILIKLFRSLGVISRFENNCLVLSKSPELVSFFEYDFSDCPDIAQTIAVTCFGLNINCKLTGLSTLKHKETDRLFALKTELEKFGANVITTADSLELINSIEPRETKNIFINTYDDHRMAMSFAPLALRYKDLQIENPSVVKKSYPEFWTDLKTIGISE
ncbi:MAG: 3-phosphoshikimate 1-carboxyvinyltransferase [Bacteroidetes bacterium]|nr:3-phosphoshikimate 1-carboxyvinyltransferase [Bacteroidota bacterium]